MRLMDIVASQHRPFVLGLDGRLDATFEVTGPRDFASIVAECPHRFVLGDDMTRACAELAFADGARLAGCLDLLRVPAPLIWVEWSDSVHRQVLAEIGHGPGLVPGSENRQAGALLRGSTDGYETIARTFWIDKSMPDAPEVIVSPLETHVSLGGIFPSGATSPIAFASDFLCVSDHLDEHMAELLGHARFRFDDRWAAYYRATAAAPEVESTVVHSSLEAVVRDVPLLLAFFLLLSAKDATRSTPVSRSAINRKRAAHGRRPLLDHVEVNASLEALGRVSPALMGHDVRNSPRLHHVRGHLVRRGDLVFWRTPHLRGSATRGMVRSRTVCLSVSRSRRPGFGSEEGSAARGQ